MLTFLFRFHNRLNEAELGGSNVESIDIGSKAGKGLLGTVGAVDGLVWNANATRLRKSIPDEGVDLDGVDVIELLQGQLDLGLVGLGVDDEDKGVLLLNLLQGALGVEGVDDDLVLIETGLVGDRLAGVLGSPGQLESLGAVEGGRGADLGLLVGVDLERV